MAKAHALVWNCSERNDERWSGWDAGHHSISNGQLVVTLSASTSAYYALTTVSTQDISASWCGCELVQRTNADTGSTETQFQYKVDDSNWFGFVISGTNIIYRKRVSASNSDTTASYSSTNHRFLRLRAEGGHVMFDTSANGTTWTNQRDVATGLDVVNGKIALVAGAYDANNTNPGAAIFDNINIPNQRSFFASLGS